MNDRPVNFHQWKEALQSAALDAPQRERFRREILAFLSHCRAHRRPATAQLMSLYLETREQQMGAEQARLALRWFYRAAKKAGRDAPELASLPKCTSPESREIPAGSRHDHPPLAALDTGRHPWERDLIRASREKGFLWRTEQTYREWAARFAEFISPRSPYAAGGAEVSAFLSALTLNQRASRSTQRQALNALVFLMQEALHRDLGELKFRRAENRQKIPTVLSQEECRRLFSGLQGTARLMAELMYGGGLRLMELLRLRIHHLDLERGRLQIYAGKGAKDRVTVLPERLKAQLGQHLQRLQLLHQEDRKNQLPGVWLPEGLAKKYSRAGEKWQWQRRGRCPTQLDGDNIKL